MMMRKIVFYLWVYIAFSLLAAITGCTDKQSTEVVDSEGPAANQMKNDKLSASDIQKTPEQKKFLVEKQSVNVDAVPALIDDEVYGVDEPAVSRLQDEEQRIADGIVTLNSDPTNDVARDELSLQLKNADHYRENMLRRAKSIMEIDAQMNKSLIGQEGAVSEN